MDEQAHFGTTRYTVLSLSVIHVPGNPMFYPRSILLRRIKAAFPGFFNAPVPLLQGKVA